VSIVTGCNLRFFSKPIVNVSAFSQQYNDFIYKALFVIIVQEMSVLSSTDLHERKGKALSRFSTRKRHFSLLENVMQTYSGSPILLFIGGKTAGIGS
jgi:hypothetical protein